MNKHYAIGKNYRVRGFSLIEVMIAMFVLSLALASFQAGQFYILQSNRSAIYFLQASQWLNELQRRISVNPKMKMLYLDPASWNDQGMKNINCAPDVCPLKVIALDDIEELKNQLQSIPKAKLQMESNKNTLMSNVRLRWSSSDNKKCNDNCLELWIVQK